MKKSYRPNAGLMVINSIGDVFMAKRLDARKKGRQMPQGGIDDGEEPFEAALRELKEETGIKSVSLIAESKNWYTYDFPAGVEFTNSKKKSFSGQTQKWFLFEFTGKESEINLKQEHPEFDVWKWVPIENVADLIIEFKREVYEQVIDEFLPFVEAVKASSKQA